MIDEIYSPEQPEPEAPDPSASQPSNIDDIATFVEVEFGGITIDLTINVLSFISKELEANVQVQTDIIEGQGVSF